MLRTWRVKVWNDDPHHCMAGAAWSVESILDFHHDVSRARPEISSLVTQSGAESHPDPPYFRIRHYG